MLGLTCVPRKVYEFLYPFKAQFRCGQTSHFVLACWIVTMLAIEPMKGTLRQISRMVPARVRYWALMRMVRSGLWDEQALVSEVSTHVLALLPAAVDGRLYLIGDTTLKAKRGRKHPLARKARLNAYAPYTFGFEMVLLIASWGSYRVPVALAAVDPRRKGHANELFRAMLTRFQPPGWAQTVVVLADAGFAANATFAVITERNWRYVMSLPRTRKFEDGKSLKDLATHLPRHLYQRHRTETPDGRRRHYWTFVRRAALRSLGDVTIILSKRRRNDGPKATKILVTNLREGSTGSIVSAYARRWGIEVTFKELKSGLHLGRMQVTRDPARVARSIALPVLAYLTLLGLYAPTHHPDTPLSIFRLKHQFTLDAFRAHQIRSDTRWRKKIDAIKAAA